MMKIQNETPDFESINLKLDETEVLPIRKFDLDNSSISAVWHFKSTDNLNSKEQQVLQKQKQIYANITNRLIKENEINKKSTSITKIDEIYSQKELELLKKAIKLNENENIKDKLSHYNTNYLNFILKKYETTTIRSKNNKPITINNIKNISETRMLKSINKTTKEISTYYKEGELNKESITNGKEER